MRTIAFSLLPTPQPIQSQASDQKRVSALGSVILYQSAQAPALTQKRTFEGSHVLASELV